MKILALSDMVVDLVYSPRLADDYGDIDLVIGCGDLPYYYLEYIATMLPVPVCYVFGNHDRTQYTADGRILNAPEGCRSLEGRSLLIGDLILVGLGGSIRYAPRGRHQYSEAEMRGRVRRLAPRLWWNRARYGRFLDILVTHSPPYGIHDSRDQAHTGFRALLLLMRTFRPRYLLHGHKHLNRGNATEISEYERTTVINVYPRYTLEIEG